MTGLEPFIILTIILWEGWMVVQPKAPDDSMVRATRFMTKSMKALNQYNKILLNLQDSYIRIAKNDTLNFDAKVEKMRGLSAKIDKVEKVGKARLSAFRKIILYFICLTFFTIAYIVYSLMWTFGDYPFLVRACGTGLLILGLVHSVPIVKRWCKSSEVFKYNFLSSF